MKGIARISFLTLYKVLILSYVVLIATYTKSDTPAPNFGFTDLTHSSWFDLNPYMIRIAWLQKLARTEHQILKTKPHLESKSTIQFTKTEISKVSKIGSNDWRKEQL